MIPNSAVTLSFKDRVIKGILQYCQYSVIGASCGLIDIGSLNLFLYLWPTESDALLALFNSIAYGLAVLNSYIWNSRITFRKGARKDYRQVGLFILQALISLVISDLVFVLAIHGFREFSLFPNWMIHNASKGLSMFLSSTSSFFFMKFLVFRRKKESFAEEQQQTR
ncbi:MAG TPA: GtrA family protein [Bacillales bacterium]|nr:GtrA family protein [Bacillales bacterium]